MDIPVHNMKMYPMIRDTPSVSIFIAVVFTFMTSTLHGVAFLQPHPPTLL